MQSGGSECLMEDRLLTQIRGRQCRQLVSTATRTQLRLACGITIYDMSECTEKSISVFTQQFLSLQCILMTVTGVLPDVNVKLDQQGLFVRLMYPQTLRDLIHTKVLSPMKSYIATLISILKRLSLFQACKCMLVCCSKCSSGPAVVKIIKN